MSVPAGLSAAEVAQRVAAGRVNRVRRSDVAEYRDLVVRNVLTLFNALVVPAAVALVALGDYRAGAAVSGFALFNTLLGLVQEVRAKRHLDRLTLLAEARVRVMRDGSAVEVPAGDVVADDVVLLAAGDSVVADGPVVEARFLEVDEALLTGESDPVARKEGERVLSGSFCVAGEGAYRAEKVGAEAFAQKTAAEARSYRYSASPLEASINRIIQILTVLAVLLCAGYVGLYWLRGFGVDELLRMVAATITSMVPQGLVLMATLAFLLAAVRMTAKGALVNRLSAVEAMAAIDTLCMDKTGTLTTNRLELARLVVVGGAEEDVKDRLRLFSSVSLDRQSKSLAAVRDALGEAGGELLDQLPFKSQNRYSAVRVRTDRGEYVLALGAPEALAPLSGDGWQAARDGLMAAGLRVLLFAEVVSLPRAAFEGTLEGSRLQPLALLGLSDELRPEAADVLKHLAAQGIDFKILSGDNPDTVRATVVPLGGVLAEAHVVSGAELESAADAAALIRGRHVFGRVSPWQKVRVVRTLSEQGRQVAMIGDGVNDVLPIKNARLGVAMGDGSRASKTVAGIVLTTNDFSLLPRVLDEGRVIVRNLRRSGKLFLTKNAFTLVLIVGCLGVLGLDFPFAPQQVTLLNFLTIGIPALLITLDHDRAGRSRGGYVAEVGWFAVRTGVVTGLAGLALMLLSKWVWQDDTPTQRTMLLGGLVLLGYANLWRALRDGEEGPPTGDRLLRWLPVAGLAVYLLVTLVPALADFFELRPLGAGRWAMVAATAVVAWGVMAAADRLVQRTGGSSTSIQWPSRRTRSSE